MKFILSLGAFLIGFDLILVILSSLLRLQEGIWLPPLLAVAFGSTLGLIPNLKTAVVRTLLTLAVFGGSIGFWFMSQNPATTQDPERFSTFFPVLALTLPVSAFIFWLVDSENRKTVSPRTWSLLGLLIAFMWLVSYFSSSQGGGGGMLHFMVTRLGVPEQFAETILVPLRKCIHFSFYGTVGLTSWAIAHSSPEKSSLEKGNRPYRLAFAVLMALYLASFDEMRQTTQPGRTGAVTDVMLDMAGAITFVAIAEFWPKRAPAKP